MDLLTRAIQFAAEAHDGARRKGDGSPAVLHAMEAAAVAATLTGDEEVLAAAVLHDTVEDAGVQPEELLARFGPRVAALVAAETENKRRELPPGDTWRVRKEETIARLEAEEDPGAAILVLGDKLSNLRSLSRACRQRGEAVWQDFHQHDSAQHRWYYSAIAAVLAPRLGDTPAFQEYQQRFAEVFGSPDRREEE